MTPKEKKHVLENVPLNDKMTGFQATVSVEKDQAYASAKHRDGPLILDILVPPLHKDPRERRARKIADRAARSFFKQPKFVVTVWIYWEDRMPIFRYREGKITKNTRSLT
jgi:hypothetical protein